MSSIINFEARFISTSSLLGIMLLLSGISAPKIAIAASPGDLMATKPVIGAKTSQSLLSQGKLAYQAGRYTEAKRLWQKAYKQNLSKLTQAQSLNYLALTSHKLGEWREAQAYLKQSLELLPENTSDSNNLRIKAQTLNTQGRLELSMGKAEAALSSWQAAAKLYRQVGDDVGVLGVEINQAQAWQNLGLYRRAQKILGYNCSTIRISV